MRCVCAMVLGLVLALLSAYPALAGGKLTLVANANQVAGMEAFFNELKAEEVELSIVDTKDIKTALDADNLMIVMTADDTSAPVVMEKLSAPDQERVSKVGGMKYALLRDPWKPGQEVVVLVAYSDVEAATLRKQAWARWWETVAGWFEINTMIVPNY